MRIGTNISNQDLQTKFKKGREFLLQKRTVSFNIVYRRSVFFSYDPSLNSSGVYWPQIYRCMIRALWIGQLVLFGVILSKKWYLIACVVGLAVMTFAFDRRISARMPGTAEFLPLSDCLAVDLSRRRWPDMAWDFLSGAYQQDALKEGDPIFPANGELGMAEEASRNTTTSELSKPLL